MLKEDQHIKGHIVFLGESGFPLGLAAIQRLTLMAKALLHAGLKTTVICRKGVWENKKIDFETKGNYEGIDYIYTSNSVYRHKGFIKRNLQKLNGLYGEFMYLRNLKKRDSLDVAIISNMSFVHMLRYRIYGAILNFPTVLNFVEMASSIKGRSSVSVKVGDYLFEHWLIKKFDGVLPISDSLMNYHKAVSPLKPAMKLPILCDFEKFNKTRKGNTEPYFLYCGSMAYMEVIDFIVASYKSLSNTKNTRLYMIVSGGSNEETALLQQELNQGFEAAPIRLFSNIPYGQLVELYINALALLIPLRPTLQDSARFPHKIGEYSASGNPIITTKVGEIKNYFEDGKTALIADSYTIDSFAEKMNFILCHPDASKTIGLKGKEIGLAAFDYKAHGSTLRKFLQKIARK